MDPATVIAIIALVVALIVACVAMSNKTSASSSADGDQPTTDEGRKIAVVRGTAWVSSTQITCWTDDYTTGG